MTERARYRDQADAVCRMAAKAASDAEREVYLSIAEGWRRLATEAERHEGRIASEPRSFRKSD